MVVNSVHWFRKGLRLHDNPALQEALSGADTVRCVYILDPWFAGAANVGINRWRFVVFNFLSYNFQFLKMCVEQCFNFMKYFSSCHVFLFPSEFRIGPRLAKAS